MITVTIDYQKQTICGFTVSGHANSAPYGSDLICAAVTAVTAGTINAIEVLAGFVPEVQLEQDGGFLQCQIPQNLDQEQAQTVQLLLKAMIITLETAVLPDNQKFLKINHNK